jgi:uncharacterized protein YndB with AHSA1/START domain
MLRLGLLALGLAALASVPAPAPPTAAELKRLVAGEVLVSSREVQPRAPREQIGRGVIDFPPERVYKAVTDYANYDEFMPFVVQADVMKTLPDGAALSSQRLRLPRPFGERHYVLRVASRVETGRAGGRTWRTEWAYVPGSGDIAGQRGSWTLTQLAPGRTLATFRLFSDPGGAVPGWLYERAVAETLPYIFQGLRLHARRSRYDG